MEVDVVCVTAPLVVVALYNADELAVDVGFWCQSSFDVHHVTHRVIQLTHLDKLSTTSRQTHCLVERRWPIHKLSTTSRQTHCVVKRRWPIHKLSTTSRQTHCLVKRRWPLSTDCLPLPDRRIAWWSEEGPCSQTVYHFQTDALLGGAKMAHPQTVYHFQTDALLGEAKMALVHRLSTTSRQTHCVVKRRWPLSTDCLPLPDRRIVWWSEEGACPQTVYHFQTDALLGGAKMAHVHRLSTTSRQKLSLGGAFFGKARRWRRVGGW